MNFHTVVCVAKPAGIRLTIHSYLPLTSWKSACAL